MNFINVKFLKNGLPAGSMYAYKTEIELQPGDKVELPSGRTGVVVDEPVDMGWIKKYGIENLKCIVRKAENDDKT